MAKPPKAAAAAPARPAASPKPAQQAQPPVEDVEDEEQDDDAEGDEGDDADGDEADTTDAEAAAAAPKGGKVSAAGGTADPATPPIPRPNDPRHPMFKAGVDTNAPGAQPIKAAPAGGVARVKDLYPKGAQMVTMVFPRPVRLTRNDGIVIGFVAGPNEVPLELADHPYLAANGVTRYER